MLDSLLTQKSAAIQPGQSGAPPQATPPDSAVARSARGGPPGAQGPQGSPPGSEGTDFLKELVGKIQANAAPMTQDQQRLDEVSKGGSAKAENRNTPAAKDGKQSEDQAANAMNAVVMASLAAASARPQAVQQPQQPKVQLKTGVESGQHQAARVQAAPQKEQAFESVTNTQANSQAQLLDRLMAMQGDLNRVAGKMAQVARLQQNEQAPRAATLVERQPGRDFAAQAAVKTESANSAQSVAFDGIALPFADVAVIEASDDSVSGKVAGKSTHQAPAMKTEDLLAMFAMANKTKDFTGQDSMSGGANSGHGQNHDMQQMAQVAAASKLNIAESHPRVDSRLVNKGGAEGAGAISGTNGSVNLRNHWELANVVQELGLRGGGSVKLKLNPIGLGEMTVSVEQVKNASGRAELNVSFKTSTVEAKDAVMGAIGELKQALKARNFELAGVEVSSSVAKEASASNITIGDRGMSASSAWAASSMSTDTIINTQPAADNLMNWKDQGSESRQSREAAWERYQENRNGHFNSQSHDQRGRRQPQWQNAQA